MIKPKHPSSWFNPRIAIYQILGFILLVSTAFQLSIIEYTPIDCDEFEHLHASWLVHTGNIPYKDFYEHHTPLLWYSISPLFSVFEDDARIVTFSRYFMFLFNLIILGVSYKIARNYLSKILSFLVIAIISVQYNYLISIEILRPEIPMVAFVLLSFHLFLKTIGEDNSIKYLLLLFLSGLSLGIAVSFKQTAVIFLIALIFSLVIIGYKQGKERKSMLKGASTIMVGFFVPVVFLLLYFYLNGALNDFLYFVFRYNLEHNAGNMLHKPFEVLSGFLDHAAFWILGFSGVIASTIYFLRGKLNDEKEISLLIFIYTSILYVAASGALWYYRYLSLVPLISIYIGLIIRRVILKNGLKYLKGNYEEKAMISAFLLLLLCSIIYTPFFIVSGRVDNVGLNLLLSNDRNWQIETMEFIWNITSSDDKVFDDQGLYIFRDHGYKYWFIHPALFNYNFSSRDLDDIPEYLNKTETKFLIYDDRIRELSNKTQKFIREHYVPVLPDGKYGVYVTGAMFNKSSLLNNRPERFYLISSGDYDVTSEEERITNVQIEIDNRTLLYNETIIYLNRGQHTISLRDYTCPENIIIRYHFNKSHLNQQPKSA